LEARLRVAEQTRVARFGLHQQVAAITRHRRRATTMFTSSTATPEAMQQPLLS